MIELRPITPDNLEDVLALQVAQNQSGYVSTVAHSLAQAYACRDTAFPFAVCEDDRPVGFLMLGYYESRRQYTLWKFLIDHRYQGKGYGREALRLAIRYAAEILHADALYTGVILGNERAKALYRAVGFEATGLVENNMQEMRLSLPQR